MIDADAKPKPYLRLMALVALLGIVSAVVTVVFMALVNGSIALIWEQAAQALGMDPRLFTLLVCTLGGLVVGLLVNYFGDHNAIFSELMQEFGKTGRLWLPCGLPCLLPSLHWFWCRRRPRRWLPSPSWSVHLWWPWLCFARRVQAL